MNRMLAIPMIAALAACGGGNSVSFSVRSGSAATAAPVRARGGALTLSSGIVLSRVRIVLADIKLESENGDRSNDKDDAEIHTGAMVVDLNAAALDGGTVQTITNASIPAGTYEEIKLKVRKAAASDSTDAAVQAMASQNASIIADGTIDGVAFSFVTSVEAEQKFEGKLVLKDGSNLTLNVDPSAWFGTSAAARLDPRVAGNRSQIEESIKTSFKAYEDDNHDGHEGD